MLNSVSITNYNFKKKKDFLNLLKQIHYLKNIKKIVFYSLQGLEVHEFTPLDNDIPDKE